MPSNFENNRRNFKDLGFRLKAKLTKKTADFDFHLERNKPLHFLRRSTVDDEEFRQTRESEKCTHVRKKFSELTAYVAMFVWGSKFVKVENQMKISLSVDSFYVTGIKK